MKACIVGYGAIGPVHAEAISRLDRVSLHAICDIDPARARLGAEKHHAIPYFRYEDCLADEDIDVIHICTPHYLHFPMITEALKHGKRVVVEKPCVMKREELTVLLRDYDVTRIFPILQNRTNDCVQAMLHRMATDRSLGRLLGIKGFLTWYRDAAYYDSADWRGTKEGEGGGVLINQAVHTLDLMTLFGGEVERVSATVANHSIESIAVEDTLEARIAFRSGAVGLLYASNGYVKNPPAQLDLDFEHGNLCYRDGMLFANGELICRDGQQFKGKPYWGNGHTKTLSDYYEKGSSLSLRDACNTLMTMFAIYESAEKGTAVSLRTEKEDLHEDSVSG